MTASWDNGVVLHDETVGIMRTYFLYAKTSHEVFAAADDGDPTAIRVSHMLVTAVAAIEDAADNSPVPRIVCPQPIRHVDDTGLFFIILPDDAQHGGAWTAVCLKCAPNYPAVIAAIDEIGLGIWPDVRKIDISEQAGHS